MAAEEEANKNWWEQLAELYQVNQEISPIFSFWCFDLTVDRLMQGHKLWSRRLGCLGPKTR